MQCFSSTYNIASASAFYLSHPPKKFKKPQNHPHFTRLTICRSAHPQIRILPEAVHTAGRVYSCLVNHAHDRVAASVVHRMGPYKPRTGQRMNHAPAILAASAIYCVHGRVVHQARGRQTVQNINKKHTLSPSAATSAHQPSNCSNF